MPDYAAIQGIPVAFAKERIAIDRWGNDITEIWICDRSRPFRMVHFTPAVKRFQRARILGPAGKEIEVKWKRARSDIDSTDFSFAGLEMWEGDGDVSVSSEPEWYFKMPEETKAAIRDSFACYSIMQTVAFITSLADVFEIWHEPIRRNK